MVSKTLRLGLRLAQPKHFCLFSQLPRKWKYLSRLNIKQRPIFSLASRFFTSKLEKRVKMEKIGEDLQTEKLKSQIDEDLQTEKLKMQTAIRCAKAAILLSSLKNATKALTTDVPQLQVYFLSHTHNDVLMNAIRFMSILLIQNRLRFIFKTR